MEQQVYESYKDWLDMQTNTKREKSISWIKDIKELNERRTFRNTCISANIKWYKSLL